MIPKQFVNEKSIETLLRIGLEPKVPGSLNTARTVIIINFDEDIPN